MEKNRPDGPFVNPDDLKGLTEQEKAARMLPVALSRFAAQERARMENPRIPREVTPATLTILSRVAHGG